MKPDPLSDITYDAQGNPLDPTYYIQGDDDDCSIRVYFGKSQYGQRFCNKTHQWTFQCCSRRACILSGDKAIEETSVVYIIAHKIAMVQLLQQSSVGVSGEPVSHE
jgi:hypothetical protein